MPRGEAHAVVEFDGDGVFGDVDGEFGVGVRPAEGDLLAGDHEDSTVGGAAGHGDRLGARAWGWAGGPGAAQPAGLIPGQRVGAGAQ